MTSRTRLLLVALLCALSFAACDSNDEFAIGGTYSGVTNTTLGTTTLTLTIPTTASGSGFSFNAALVEEDEGGQQVNSASFIARGAYDHPTITLTVEDETISGTVNAAGDRLTLDDDTGLGAFVLVRR